MEPRISLVTLPVADVARSRQFYVDGLGWPVHLEAPGVVMIRTGDRLLLSLWAREEFEAEVGALGQSGGVPPLTLAHNLATDAEVDRVLADAASAGAVVGPAERRAWGGYSGYFADPDGVRWEIACAGTDGPLAFLLPSGSA